jgi:tyrosine-protein phosphatase SIW14
MKKNLYILIALQFSLSVAVAAPVVDIPNFMEVTPLKASPDGKPAKPVLYRGGRPTLAGLQKLKALGVKTIIDLQGGDLLSPLAFYVKWTEKGELPENIAIENKQATDLGMNFHNIPLDSLEKITPKEETDIDKILAIIHDPNNQPVFVHCEHGKDRTGMIIAMERVAFEGMDPVKAREEWIADGHGFFSRIFTGNMDKYFEKWVAARNLKYLVDDDSEN